MMTVVTGNAPDLLSGDEFEPNCYFTVFSRTKRTLNLRLTAVPANSCFGFNQLRASVGCNV